MVRIYDIIPGLLILIGKCVTTDNYNHQNHCCRIQPGNPLELNSQMKTIKTKSINGPSLMSHDDDLYINS